MERKGKVPKTNRKRGGRTPRSRPAVVSCPTAAKPDLPKEQHQSLLIYLGILLFLFAFGDLFPPGSHHGKVVSEHEWRLATLCGVPFALVIGAWFILRAQRGLLALCLVAMALIGFSRWLTLDTSVSGVHLLMRLLVSLPTGYRVYQYVFQDASDAPPSAG